MDRLRFAVALPAILALAAPAAAEKRAGSFPEGSRYEEPAAFAPEHVSRYQVHVVEMQRGHGAARIPGTGSGKLLVWTMPLGGGKGAAPRSSLDASDGRALRADEARSAMQDMGRAGFEAPDLGLAPRGQHEVVWLDRPAPGVHRVQLEGEGAALVVAAEPDSPLTLAVTAGPISRQPGEPVTVRAAVRDGDVGVTGATLWARLAGPDGRTLPPLRLRDDGRSDDGAAGDGVYGAVARHVPSTAGAWSVRVDATGQDGRGAEFARTGGSTVVSEPGVAALAGVRAKHVPGEGLLVLANADVKTAGRYRLDVVVAGAASADGSRRALAWAEEDLELSPGRRALRLLVPADQLPGVGGEPLHVDVRLLGFDPIGVAGRAVVEVR